MTANTNAARINARFTGEDARRFKELQLKTRQSASAVLREAVRRYHSQEVKPRRSAYEIMMESGFIGSVTGMNAKKLSIGEMGGAGQGHWDGVPMSLLVRMALEEAAHRNAPEDQALR